jgi:hypothetical protein
LSRAMARLDVTRSGWSPVGVEPCLALSTAEARQL